MLVDAQVLDFVVMHSSRRPSPEILTPARCRSDLRPARIASPDGPAHVRFFIFSFLFLFSSLFLFSFF
jgi:hypothetical protein